MLEDVWNDDEDDVGTMDIQILLSWFFETADEYDSAEPSTQERAA